MQINNDEIRNKLYIANYMLTFAYCINIIIKLCTLHIVNAIIYNKKNHYYKSNGSFCIL